VTDEEDDEPFSVERWTQLLTCLESMNVVDCPEFRRFALYGRKNVSERDLPHRTALKNMIFRQYLEDHKELLNEIKAALGRVSFTADIWSDPNLTSFLAMTCRFSKRNAAGRLEVANRLLAFRTVEGSHDGDNIGQIMYDIVKDADTHQKV